MIIGGSLRIRQTIVKHFQEKVPKIQTSHAILLVSGNYILQLRDNKANIAAPGQWSLFGGMKKDNETPLETIVREIKEELSINPPEFQYLWFVDYYSAFERACVRTFFFTSDISALWQEQRLMEGQAVGVFSYEQIRNLDMPPVMRETIEKFHKQAKNAEN